MIRRVAVALIVESWTRRWPVPPALGKVSLRCCRWCGAHSIDVFAAEQLRV
jgi:hypothetical protein